MAPPLIFAIAFAVSLALTPVIARVARHFRVVDVPRALKHVHAHPVPRWGGLALALGFFTSALAIYWLYGTGRMPQPQDPDDWLRLRGVLLGAGVATLFGAYDDWHEQTPRSQFVAQFVLAIIAIAHTVFLERFTNPLTNELVILPMWLVIPVSLAWLMGMINTVNFLDGLDGLATGVGAIAALLFAVHSYGQIGQLAVGLFPVALVGACLGFLPWNFHPARVFMGTAGSMFLGYNLAAFSLIAPAKLATALLVLGIPILDVAWQIMMRVRHGRAPWLADRSHLHHRLFDLGLSQRQVVIGYYVLCAGFGGLALVLQSRLYKLIALGILSVIALGALALLTRQFEPQTSRELMASPMRSDSPPQSTKACKSRGRRAQHS
ncbi:MAG: putative undecaprenyl-phosphate N-acetylglucosaminyl 1-phosphate transferase [Anaerolineales bacterium]|nr:putative undecaprenyl-phosphate N-acetylglucosaminyl 1-phosphate transferase [Anaerolineales bacterium]